MWVCGHEAACAPHLWPGDAEFAQGNICLKILLVEHWASHIYAEPFFHRLIDLGESAHGFKEHEYFRADRWPGALRSLGRLEAKAQEKYRLGPRLHLLNRDLAAQAHALKPDVVFVFRGAHVFPETLQAIKKGGAFVVGWNNDDPFSARYPTYVWRHFVNSIPLYDRLFAYRHANVEDFRRHGCPRVALLRSFYLRDEHFPIADLGDSPYACDVSFTGHWEDDGRSDYIGELLRADDLNFRLWGTRWERAANAAEIRARMGTIGPLYKATYNLALNSSKICLAFLSRLNNDTYTRRCFEIPAAGAFMLAQHTDDLASLFKPGEEAEYFRNVGEMLDKARYFLAHPDARVKIAAAGHRRLLKDGHEALDRARTVRDSAKKDMESL